MFIPNTTVTLVKREKHLNLFGDYSYNEVESNILAGIVRLIPSVKKTSVRADTSGSRGSAEEIEAESIILVLPNTNVNIGDVIKTHGLRLEVVARHPRIAVTGKLDHYELNLRVQEDDNVGN